MLEASNDSKIADLLNSFEKKKKPASNKANEENEFGQLGSNEELSEITIG